MNLGKLNSRKEYWFTAGIALLFFIIRVPFFDIPFERDEGEYAYAAMLLKNGLFPYEHSFLQKPPMIIYTYMIADFINPDAEWPIRALLTIFYIITGIFVKKIIDLELGEGKGIYGMVLFLSMLSIPVMTTHAANTEMFMIAPMMMGIYYLLNGETKKELWQAGIFSIMAVLYKPVCIPILLLFGLYFLFSKWSSGEIFKKIAQVLLAGFCFLLLCLLPFLLGGQFSNMWEQNVVFNSALSSVIGYNYEFLLFFMSELLRYWWLMILLFLVILFQNTIKAWWYAGACLLVMLVIYRFWYGHYYLMLLPFLAIVSTIALWMITEKIRVRKTLVMSLFTLFCSVLFYRPAFALYTDDELSRIKQLYAENFFVEARMMGKELKERTKKEDKIYIAGSEAQILYYAKRWSPTKYIIAYPFTLDTPLAPKYRQELKEELTQDLPAYIVFVNSPKSWTLNAESAQFMFNFLVNLLKEKYTPAGGIKHVEGVPEWVEEIPEEKELQKNHALVLFKLKTEN